MTDPLDHADIITARLAATGIACWMGETQPSPPAGKPWVHWWPEPGDLNPDGLCQQPQSRTITTRLVCCGHTAVQALACATRVQAALSGWISPVDNPAHTTTGPLIRDPASGAYSVTLIHRHTTGEHRE